MVLTCIGLGNGAILYAVKSFYHARVSGKKIFSQGKDSSFHYFADSLYIDKNSSWNLCRWYCIQGFITGGEFLGNGHFLDRLYFTDSFNRHIYNSGRIEGSSLHGNSSNLR